MSCNSEAFVHIVESPVSSVLTATGEEAIVVGQGDIQMSGIGGVAAILQGVLYVPSFKTSLLSVSSIFDSGGHIQYQPGGNLVEIFSKASATPVLMSERVGDLWKVSNKIIKSTITTIYDSVHLSSPAALVSRGEKLEDTKATLEDWHARLGHLGWRQLRKMFTKDMVKGAQVTDLGLSTDKNICPACLEGKMSEASFPSV